MGKWEAYLSIGKNKYAAQPCASGMWQYAISLLVLNDMPNGQLKLVKLSTDT